jgi:hypothetical protein
MAPLPDLGFGHLICRYRLAAGLSQEDLAERAGLSARGVSDLERGARVSPGPKPSACWSTPSPWGRPTAPPSSPRPTLSWPRGPANRCAPR